MASDEDFFFKKNEKYIYQVNNQTYIIILNVKYTLNIQVQLSLRFKNQPTHAVVYLCSYQKGFMEKNELTLHTQHCISLD